MADPWLYVRRFFDAARNGVSPVFGQVRWVQAWVNNLAAQGQLAASVDTSNDGHLYLLEGELNSPEYLGPLGRHGPAPNNRFSPIRLRVEHDAVEWTTRVTVHDIKDDVTQVMDHPELNPYLFQAWGPAQGNKGILTIAFFDKWDGLSVSIASTLRALTAGKLNP
jgi:hypothetical protein